MVEGTATFTELCRQVGMIVDETSLATWAHNINEAKSTGKLSEDQLLTLRTMYAYRKQGLGKR